MRYEMLVNSRSRHRNENHINDNVALSAGKQWQIGPY